MRAVACNEPLRIPVTSQQDIGQGNASYRPVRSAIEWAEPLVMSRDIFPRGNVPRQKPAQVDPCSIDVCDQLPIIAAMPENDVAQVYELLLLAEKLRLRAEVSKQTEAENERGTWLDLPELIAAYRAQKRSA